MRGYAKRALQLARKLPANMLGRLTLGWERLRDLVERGSRTGLGDALGDGIYTGWEVGGKV